LRGCPATVALVRSDVESRGGGIAVAVASKVPQVTAYFWITKVLTTGMGEATSDYLGRVLGSAVAIPVGAFLLVATLVLQFRLRRYVAWAYWSAIVAVSIFGTMFADGIHDGAGVPYAASTVVFSVVLAGILVAWYRSQNTLSIHSIHTTRREAFYWATVMGTFALGTAAGDFTASSLKLGYLPSVVLFAVVIVIPPVARWKFDLNAIVAFWFAYIVTRPLGASFADWAAVSRHSGGLGQGTGRVSLAMTILILLFVGFLALTRKDIDLDPAVVSADN
jgi:uncharacterized membrane-anchored protein